MKPSSWSLEPQLGQGGDARPVWVSGVADGSAAAWSPYSSYSPGEVTDPGLESPRVAALS